MKKIEEVTCIKFETKSQNHHQELFWNQKYLQYQLWKQPDMPAVTVALGTKYACNGIHVVGKGNWKEREDGKF